MKNPQLRIKKENEDEQYDEQFDWDTSMLFNYTDENENIINNKHFQFGKSFNEGFAFVYNNHNWDIIDEECKSVLNKFKNSHLIKLALDNVIPENHFFLKNYVIGKNLVISVDFIRFKRELLKLFPLKFDYNGNTLPPWEDDYMWNYSQQALFLINIEKEEPCFSFIEDVTLRGEGLVGIKKYGDWHSDKWIYLNIEDYNNHIFEPQIECPFDRVYSFNEGLAKVEKDNLYGFINKDGETVIPIDYDDARSFKKGYAAVAIANCRPSSQLEKKIADYRWNFIDKKNQSILKSTFDCLTSIHNDCYYAFIDYYDFKKDHGYYRFNLNSLGDNIPIDKKGINDEKTIRGWNIPWAMSNVIGQLHPPYLIDLLTAENSEKLGFKRWYVYSRHNPEEASSILNKSTNLPIDTLEIDFDTTQSEFDYLLKKNSLEMKYGSQYTNNKWRGYIKRSSCNFDFEEQDPLDGIREMYNDDPDWYEKKFL